MEFNPPRTLIIAEAGVNHNGSAELARQLVDAAVEAGADVVKFQTFKANAVVSRHAAKANYQLRTTASQESQLEMIHKLELDESAHRMLAEHCRFREIEFLSTPFDLDSVAFLETLGLNRIKIASGEITNGPLLLAVARTKKQVILSSGMSTIGEIETALSVLAYGYLNDSGSPSVQTLRDCYYCGRARALLRQRVILLHCTTEYPAPYEDLNLRAMDTMAAAFGLPVGYSDHSLGIHIPVAAVARGASVIEKHFTMDRTLPGPDHIASVEPHELKMMIKAIREVEVALGDGVKVPTASERKNIEIARKSLVAAKAIRLGEPFTADNLTAKRPATGKSPMLLWSLLGKNARRSYAPDDPINGDN